jgi:hypothetical protein
MVCRYIRMLKSFSIFRAIKNIKMCNGELTCLSQNYSVGRKENSDLVIRFVCECVCSVNMERGRTKNFKHLLQGSLRKLLSPGRKIATCTLGKFSYKGKSREKEIWGNWQHKKVFLSWRYDGAHLQQWL